jgi:hypothetical protein
VAGGSMASLGIILLTWGRQWQGLVLCCSHALLVRITYGMAWGAMPPPWHSYVGMHLLIVLKAIIAREKGVNVCAWPPPPDRLLVTCLNMRPTKLAGDSGHIPLGALARTCPPPA